MFYEEPRYLVAGDRYISMEIANEMNIVTSFRALAITEAIKAAQMEAIVETIITYRAVMVYFDNQKIKLTNMIDRLKQIVRDMPEMDEVPSRLFELPCRYGGKWGPDLKFVAKVNKLSG